MENPPNQEFYSGYVGIEMALIGIGEMSVKGICPWCSGTD